jgi:predicted ribonuclease toxin of YeeF-YezG toxin-antitoxin module
MVFSYIFIPNTPKFITHVKGNVTLSGLITLVQTIWDTPTYRPQMDSLMDLREADMTLSPADITELTNMLINDDRTMKGTFIMLVNKPFETALSMVFESKLVSRQNIQIFSTEEAAIKEFRITPEEFKKVFSSDATTVVVKNGNTTTQKKP